MLLKSNELQKKIIVVSIIGGASADSEAQRWMQVVSIPTTTNFHNISCFRSSSALAAKEIFDRWGFTATLELKARI